MMWQVAFGLALSFTLSTIVAVRALLPGVPRLQSAINRVDSAAEQTPDREQGWPQLDRIVRTLGAWLTQRLQDHHVPGILPRQQDLAITGSSLPVHLGEKATLTLLGAVLGPVLAGVAGLSWASVAGGAVVFAGLGYWFGEAALKQKAERQRSEFIEAAVIYLELLAIARLSGAGAAQSMEEAAQIADHPGMDRIGRVLAQSRWSGISAWQGLDREAKRLDLPHMRTIADIVRSAGEDESEIYANLRAQSASLRNAQVAQIKKDAKRAQALIALPIIGMLFIFAAGLTYPFIQGLYL